MVDFSYQGEPTRVALNFPVLVGVDFGSSGSSPKGKNLTSPVTVVSDSKVPLNNRFPTSPEWVDMALAVQSRVDLVAMHAQRQIEASPEVFDEE